MEAYEVKNLLIQERKLTIKETLIQLGLLKPFITRAEANRAYGRSVVENWIQAGLIRPVKDGEKSAMVRIDRLEIESVALASNRTTYLPTVERN